MSALNFELEFNDETIVSYMPINFSFSKSKVFKLTFSDESTKVYSLIIVERGLLDFEINFLSSYKQGFDLLGLYNVLDSPKLIVPRFKLPEGASSIPKSGESPTFVSEDKLLYKVVYSDGSTEDIYVYLKPLEGFQIDYMVVKEQFEGVFHFNDLKWKQDIATVELSDLIAQADDTGHFKVYQKRVYEIISIGKSISKHIGNLSYLRIFTHHGPGADIEVLLPDSFSKLILLREINFIFMKLEDLPAYFSNFIFVDDLYLSANNLTKFPAVISSLTNLIELTVQGNYLTSDLPDDLSALTNLRKLVLSSTKLRKIPNVIAKLPSLEILNLNNNDIGDTSPDLSGLTKLRKLFLENSGISKIPSSLFQNTQLVYHITASQIIGLQDSFSGVKNLNLSIVFYKKDKMTALPGALFQLKNITRLIIWGKTLDGISDEIGVLENLKDFELKVSPNITELPASIGNLANLSSFTLWQMENLNCLPQTFWDLLKAKGTSLHYRASGTGISSVGDVDCAN